jgi:nicotinamidase-related amidase/type 1 glutamine amidotransferase
MLSILPLVCLCLSAQFVAANSLELHTRSQKQNSDSTNEWSITEQTVKWDSKKTAIIVCDMWDKHWCRGASERVAEIAPRMNEVLKEARRRGVTIIHAPSDTMAFYKDYPQRKKAQQAPKSKQPEGINTWKSLNMAKEGPLPIDDSDGGCNDVPQCANYKAWKSETPLLEIAEEDYISDSGEEIYNVLEQLGIDNVILLGVHTNMCVLGRPFSIRQMVSLRKNVLLMRDMTDTMYNSRKRPWVSHFVGTDLVIGHIEKHWCPTITSIDLLGGEPFRFKDDKRKKIAFIIGENEYQTWETLPAFAKKELEPRGYKIEMVMASTTPGDPEFKNYEAIKGADLLILSARRRPAKKEMLELMREHLASGKPLLGIRTACHAFAPIGADREKLKDPQLGEWPQFDPEVLGGHYSNHYGNAAVKLQTTEGDSHQPVLTGVDITKLETHGSLYKVRPLADSTTPLLEGTVEGHASEPVAWINSYGPNHSRIFYTSLGHPDDFQNASFRRLLLNAILWSMDDQVPPREWAMR